MTRTSKFAVKSNEDDDDGKVPATLNEAVSGADIDVAANDAGLGSSSDR